jgi:hypothetical protein
MPALRRHRMGRRQKLPEVQWNRFHTVPQMRRSRKGRLSEMRWNWTDS